ncbi:MAG: hypothetical protein KAY22_09410 [Rhizorhabdus sp.]|uniref:hypothetical protein n=1 Tax=Rhizorhabdus sp. TaxID=1968843 RepID=UPI001B64081C|nr:hypothetical protein [Rhizorhabdus sp.]MBP8232511.1 hypothetical protein [Rhizorhabdus sp.]
MRDIDLFLAALRVCEAVEASFQLRPQLSNPNDEIVLETAVNGRADELVTPNAGDFSKALRDLVHCNTVTKFEKFV